MLLDVCELLSLHLARPPGEWRNSCGNKIDVFEVYEDDGI
jgi:hypothetical protein